MAEVEEYLIDGGLRPGLPGNHGPGLYLIDYEMRTIRPKPLEQGDELVQKEEGSVASLNAKNEGLPSEPEEEQIVESEQPTQEEDAEPDSSE